MTDVAVDDGRVLSFRDPGAPFAADQIGNIYADFKEAASSKDKPFTDDTGKFAQVAQNSGTHILKLLNKQSEDHVLRLAAPGVNRRPKFFPSMNAALGKYAKIIFQPVAILGVPGYKSLVDHILEPDDISAAIEASFVEAFSKESLLALKEGLLEDRSGVGRLHAQNFPVVYAPSPDGGDLQLTPIAPLQVYADFKGEVIPEVGSKESIRLSRQEVTSKTQNISIFIGGPRVRFSGSVPPALANGDAGVIRMVKGGPIPAPSSEDLTDRLDHLVKLHYAKTDYAAGKGYFNADMEKGLRRLAGWLIDEAIAWVSDIEEAAQEIEAEFVMPKADYGLLLLRGYRGDHASREKVRVALRDSSFRGVLERKMA